MYRNVVSYLKGGEEIIWESTWDEDGNRIEIETPIKPYLYYEDSSAKSDALSMNRKPLRFVEFNSSFDRNDWISGSKNVPLYEKLSSPKQYLLNKYYGMEQNEDFAKYKLRTFFFDIEVEIQNEFPDPVFANYPLNVISVYDSLTSSVYVWTYKKDIFNSIKDSDISKILKEVKNEYENDVNIEIYRFESERELIRSFLKFWEKNYPDIVSGWNIDGFDIPYLINRIKKVMPEDTEKILSPISWHKRAIRTSVEQKLKNPVLSYHIMGVSLCDYMNLYKKFLPKSQQSWKLDYIAKNDTGKGKLDYYDMGYESMKEFMQKDFATFTKYNIIDTILVKQIDDKRQFIALMRRICNMGLCEYESIFKSIPYILGALCIEARSQGLKFLTDANKDDQHKNDGAGFTGAFVFPTSRGFYENGIMSFDFNSLYPNVIMSVNMSPETMVGKVVSEIGEKDDDIITIQRVNGTKINVTKQQFDEILEKKCSISANNTLFLKSTNRWGIIPSFLEKLYKNRVNIKNEMKKNKILVKELNEKIKKLKEELMNYEN